MIDINIEQMRPMTKEMMEDFVAITSYLLNKYSLEETLLGLKIIKETIEEETHIQVGFATNGRR